MKTPSFAHEIGESALAGVGRNNMWISSIWNGFGKARKHQVLHTKLENLHWQGWAGIIFVNIFYLKWLREGMKTPSFAHEIGESALAGVGRNNICEYLHFYLKWLWEGMKTPSFAREIGESALAGVGRNNMWISSIWNGFGKAWKHKVLHMKLENLPWQGWAGIIYVNIFYLKWLWEGMKTPSFAHEIGESALAGVGRNNIREYLLFEKLWKGMKTQSFAHEIEE